MKRTSLLTEGPILKGLLLFALPMMLGNLLQQIYNVTDTLIVGRFIGPEALAAVGASYSLMTFLTSLIIGFCMGSGALFSTSFGAGEMQKLKNDLWLSMCFIGMVAVLISLIVFPGTGIILKLLQVPDSVYPTMFVYIRIIFCGIIFTAIYNYYAFLLRAVGNSTIPLIFLAVSSIINIVLDLIAVVGLKLGVAGAAGATVFAQAIAGIGIALYVNTVFPQFRIGKKDIQWNTERFRAIILNVIATGMQQSVMNFGILMIQGLVNTFGAIVMAAFAAAVKIDTLAYMPAQEFGNAYSLFISQNFGAEKKERIKKGSRYAFIASIVFCLFISMVVWIYAEPLMCAFVDANADGKTIQAIVGEGIRYLHIEGAMYIGIGMLFLWYGYFRGVQKPEVSLLLTIISLGTRVALSYALAHRSPLGVSIIWMSIPIGWFLADLVGGILYREMNCA